MCLGCVLQIWADEVGRPDSPCIQENCTVSRNATAKIVYWSIFACILNGSVLIRTANYTLHLSNEL